MNAFITLVVSQFLSIIRYVRINFFILISSSFLYGQVNFWEQTGPYGGPVLALEKNTSGEIFAGTEQGVYRSTNDGETWVRTGTINTIKNPEVQALAINADGYIFAGLHNDGLLGSGVFRSTDNGIRWTESGLTGYGIQSLVINPSGEIFAGCEYNGVYKSTDQGKSWTQSGLLNLDVQALEINRSNGFLFAGVGRTSVPFPTDGVYISTNNGLSWSQTSLDTVCILNLTINTNGHIFAGTWFDGAFRSTDNGITWISISNGLNTNGVLTLEVNDVNGNIFAGTLMEGIFRSTNNGQNWTQTNTGLSHKYVADFVINNIGDVFAGTINGIFKSTDYGNNWTEISTGLNNAAIFSLAISTSDQIFAGTYYDLLTSTDNGDSWNKTNLTEMVGNLVINSLGHLFASTSVIYRSTDNGNNWIQVFDSANGYLAVNYNDQLFASTWNYDGVVFRSTDNGKTWTHILDGQFVTALGINSAGHIFAGIKGGILRSTNEGITWEQLNIGLSFPYEANAFAFNSNDHIFAGIRHCHDLGCVGHGIFRSIDNGNSWEQLTLDSLQISSIIINSLGHIFAGSGNFGYGVYGYVHRSTDNGTNWEELSTGLLPNSNVTSLAINSSGQLFAGTVMSSIFRSVQSTTSVKQTEYRIPIAFSLEQNYPNPFNPSTKIKYSIPKSSQVTIKIFDALGQEIETLINEDKLAGTYEVNWNAPNLPNGVYFYQLKAGNFVETRKMTLMK